MARRAPKSLTRTPNKKHIKQKLIVFCEGKNTEPQLIEEFKLVKGNNLVDVELVRAGGVPCTLVNKAKDKKKELDADAKKSKDPIDKMFQVWVVFDRDEHPNVDQAIKNAISNNIKLAYSNPCFEIWPILHLKNFSRHIERGDLQKLLQKEIKTYSPKNGKHLKLGDFKPENFELAKKERST